MAPMQTVPGLGPVTQLAYVSEDFDAALAAWTAFGVGPFFRIDHVPFVEVRYRGAAIDLDISTAFAYWGDIQIEVIHQHNRSPSIFRDWQDNRRSDMHHVCIQVDDLVDARDRCVAQGLEILQEKSAGAAGEFFYARSPDGPDLMVEFARVGEPFRVAFDAMRQAALEWDGSRPVRPITEVLALG